MVLLQNVTVLSDQPSLLVFNDLPLLSLKLISCFPFCDFHFSLLFVHLKFLLPQPLDLFLMLELLHSSALSVHLFDSIVLCELLEHLSFELILDSLFLSHSFSLHLLLVSLSSKKIFLVLYSLGFFSSFLLSQHLLVFFLLQLVSQVFNVLLLSSSLLFFFLKSLEDLFSLRFCNSLLFFDIAFSLVLQLCVLADHFILESINLSKSVKVCFLLHERSDHVSLSLVLFCFGELHHLHILIDHLLNNSFHVRFLLFILSKRLFLKSFSLDHLLLKVLIVKNFLRVYAQKQLPYPFSISLSWPALQFPSV